MRHLFTLSMLCAGLLLLPASVGAQQQAQYSMYASNPLLFNPASAGMADALLLDARLRKQWAGALPGAPEERRVSAQMPLYIARSGLGISLEQQLIAAEEWLNVKLAYNFQGELRNSRWALGADIGWQQQGIRGDMLRTPGGIYEGPTVQHNDNRLFENNWQQAWLTAGLGAFWQSEQWEAGLSVQGISLGAFAKQNPPIALKPHYYLYSACRLEWGTAWLWQPSLLLKSDLVSWQLDLSSVWEWNGNISGGLALRGYDRLSLDAVVLSVGYRLSEQWRLAYSYDWTLSALRRVSDGSHEFWLQYTFGTVPGKGKLPPIIYNPRF